MAGTARTDDGRANALTVVIPLARGGQWWLRGLFAAMRLPFARQRSFRGVDRFEFISAIRWSLLPPFDPPRWIPTPGEPEPWRRTPDQRWQLLFESNFDGDWDDYLDTFGADLSLPLLLILRAGHGFPGYSIRGLFKAYAKALDHVPEHYAAACPSLTARDVRRELDARWGVPRRERLVAGGGWGRVHPRWTTLLLPIEPGRTGAAARAARALREPTPLFLAAGHVHFSRVVVLRRTPQDRLLITLTHDGELEPLLYEILRLDREAPRPDPTQPSRLRALLECVDGFPVPSEGWWDDDAVVAFLVQPERRIRVAEVAFCPHPGVRVPTLRSFVADPQRNRDWPARRVIPPRRRSR